jgi:hypothetical protein
MTKLLAIALMIVALAMPACGGESESAGPTGEADTATVEGGGEGGDETTASSDRCLPVPKALISAIEDGLRKTGKETGIQPKSIVPDPAAAVRSDDFEKVFYVSAIIAGAEQVGTWATNSLKVGEGLIIAADPVAMEFTDWGEAAQPGSPVAEVQGLETDGANEFARLHQRRVEPLTRGSRTAAARYEAAPLSRRSARAARRPTRPSLPSLGCSAGSLETRGHTLSRSVRQA